MLYASMETSDSIKAHQAAMLKTLDLFEELGPNEKNKMNQDHVVQMHSTFDGLYQDGGKSVLIGSAKEKFATAMQDMMKVVSQ